MAQKGTGGNPGAITKKGGGGGSSERLAANNDEEVPRQQAGQETSGTGRSDDGQQG